MEERHASTVMLVKDDERRARDVAGVEPEPGGDALREHRLPRSELAPEREHVARTGEAREAFTDALGVQGRLAHEIDAVGATRRVRSPFRARICGAQ